MGHGYRLCTCKPPKPSRSRIVKCCSMLNMHCRALPSVLGDHVERREARGAAAQRARSAVALQHGSGRTDGADPCSPLIDPIGEGPGSHYEQLRHHAEQRSVHGHHGWTALTTRSVQPRSQPPFSTALCLRLFPRDKVRSSPLNDTKRAARACRAAQVLEKLRTRRLLIAVYREGVQ